MVRHAKASEVKLQMTVGDTLQIDLIDNGRGFDPGTGVEGHGLKNCAGRIAKIGGSFHIESQGGTGTIFNIEIPLQALTVFPAEAENHVLNKRTLNQNEEV
jgi:signal transduction histidine kinase